MNASNASKIAKELQIVARTLSKRLKMGFKKVSTHAYKKLIQETPKGYTGQTRRSWKLRNKSTSSYISFNIGNSSKIMKYLEDGTKAHGPRTAKYLFIPLDRKTALRGLSKSSKFGKNYVLTRKVKGIKALNIVKKRTRIVERQSMRTLNNILKTI